MLYRVTEDAVKDISLDNKGSDEFTFILVGAPINVYQEEGSLILPKDPFEGDAWGRAKHLLLFNLIFDSCQENLRYDQKVIRLDRNVLPIW